MRWALLWPTGNSDTARLFHPMSWLAVTFTTQEINSLIRPLGLGCLAAVNLLSREGCYQPASGAAAPDIGLETWLELSLVTASGPHQVFNSLWKTCCGESDSDRRLQFLRRLLVLCGLRPGLSITQDERGAAWSGTVRIAKGNAASMLTTH